MRQASNPADFRVKDDCRSIKLTRLNLSSKFENFENCVIQTKEKNGSEQDGAQAELLKETRLQAHDPSRGGRIRDREKIIIPSDVDSKQS